MPTSKCIKYVSVIDRAMNQIMGRNLIYFYLYIYAIWIERCEAYRIPHRRFGHKVVGPQGNDNNHLIPRSTKRLGCLSVSFSHHYPLIRRSALSPPSGLISSSSSTSTTTTTTSSSWRSRLFDKLGDEEASDLADYAQRASADSADTTTTTTTTTMLSSDNVASAVDGSEVGADAATVMSAEDVTAPATATATAALEAPSTEDASSSSSSSDESAVELTDTAAPEGKNASNHSLAASRTIDISEAFPEMSHGRNVSDLLAIERRRWNKLFYNATVLKVRNERIEVVIPDFNAFGIIPLGLPVDSRYRREYLPGTNVVVNVHNVLTDNTTLVLSMRFDKVLNSNARRDLSSMLQEGGQSDRVVWLEGVVSSALPSGLHVRLPNSDITGFVPLQQVPILLVEELRYRWMLDEVERLKASGVDTSNAQGPDGTMLSNPAVLSVSAVAKNLTLDKLFSRNDVVRFRISSVKSMTNEIELTMMAPLKKSFENPIEDLKAKSKKIVSMSLFTGIDESIINPSDASLRDALNSLKWWRGHKFDHDYTEEKVARRRPKSEEETSVDEVMRESQDMIAGRWRRLVETALIESQKESKAMAAEKEERRIEEEIGVLNGMHEDFEGDFLGVGEGYIENLNMLGTYMDRSMVPPEWKDNVTFFDELDTYINKHDAVVAKGEYQEKVELNQLAAQLLKEMEAEAGAQRRRGGRGAPGPTPQTSPAAAAVEAALTPTGETGASAARGSDASSAGATSTKKLIPALNRKFKLIDESK